MYQHVLIPLDGSDYAAAAIAHASAIAKLSGASVRLLRVIETIAQIADDPSLRPMPEVADMSQDALASRRYDQQSYEARSYLEEKKRQLEGEGLSVGTVVREGLPQEAILAEAQGSDIDLIVLTAYGEGGSHVTRERAVFGGVADAVLRGSRIPVLVVYP